MKKTRKVLLTVLSVLTIAAVSLGAASCVSDKENSSSQTTDNEFRQVYAMYVTYAEEQGITPLSYEAWLMSVRGEKGDKGDKGDQGEQGVGIEKVEYDADGNLVITFTDGTTQTVEMPEPETHVHTFGDWTQYSDPDAANQVFFRVCLTCSQIEWKLGSHTAHNWTVVTTPPTCQAQGYDTKTCSICGKVEVENYTDKVDHAWATEYSFDNSFHWYECNTCDEIKDKAEHTPDESGECSVCKALVGATEGVMYDVSTDGTYAEVIGYEGTATRVRIADTYNDLPVKTIYKEAFYQNKIITSVIIPDSVTSIGRYAFRYCNSLTSVKIPDSVTSIGEYAFANCSSLTSVEIPDSVTSISYGAFYNCSSLTSVEIPDSVTSIGGYAFYFCSSLTSVVIGDSVTSIGQNAFNGCSSLTSVVIGGSVTSIGLNAFYGCSSLTFHEYGNCQYLGNEENPYFALIQAKTQNYSSYTIHEDTKVIADYAFSGCTRMSSIVIPDSVTSIGNGAFEYCSSLTSVVIGGSVTSIGYGAFYNCRSLTSVYYKGTASEWSAISIGSDVFYNTNATKYYYSETEPTEEGDYWHYVDGKVTVW